MKQNNYFGAMTFLVAFVLVLGLVGCDTGNGPGGGGGNPQTVTYTGTANSVMYTLKITENTNRAVYTPQGGDSYELTAGANKSTGAVTSYTAGVLGLQPSLAGASSFSATVSGSNLTNLTGDTKWDNGSTFTAPGALTTSGGGSPTVPGAVTNFTATPGNGQVSLSWSAPSNNGGSAITGYEVTRDNWANKVTKTASELSHTYTGLTNGTQYTFKIRAINAQGAGVESSQSGTPTAGGGGTDTNAYVQSLIAYVGRVTVPGQTVVKYKITSLGGYDEVSLFVVEINQSKPDECDVTIYVGWPELWWYNYYKGNTNTWSGDELAQMTWVDSRQCYWKFSENENTTMRLNVISGSEYITVQ